MGDISTVKIDELFRKIPENSGLDPRLIEEARTELNMLKFRAGVSIQSHKQKDWSKTDIDKLQEELRDKDTEIFLLKRQLQDRSKLSRGGHGDADTRRSSKIKDNYMGLYQHEWKATFHYFKQIGWNEIEIILFLQRILRASYTFCRDVGNEQLQNIEGEALYPTATWMDDEGIINRLQQPQLNKEISQLAKLYQRTTAEECLPALQKTFIQYVLPTFIDMSTETHDELKRYTKKCIEVTWSMRIQDPPMVFIDKLERGSDFDTERFKKYTTNGGDKYDYLVWPALLLQRGGAMLCKGVAQPITTASVRERSPTRTPATRSITARSNDGSQQFADNNSWKKVESRPTSILSTESPSKVYKWAPNREATNPRSPYFDPYSSRAPHTADNLATSRHLSREQGRFSRPLSEVNDDEVNQGNLTVMWRNKKTNRMPTAP
ncbi:hypothetical protein ACF0H5_009556 [Mactra antiquata]